MSIVSPAWIFTQLGGDKKVLTLAGQEAPHGRPRQKPVVTDGIEARNYTVYYDGNDQPTRHIFGNKLDNFELVGRFSDKFGGQGYALKKTEYIKGFLADNQELTVTCGNLISVRGYMHTFKPGRESSNEVAWTMSILIDSDDFLPRSQARKDAIVPTPQTYVDQIAAQMLVWITTPREPSSLKGSLFDTLDSLVTTANSALATLQNVAGQMDSFEKALIGDIRRFRAGVGQVRSGLLAFRTVYESLQADLALQSERADESLRFSDLQSSTATATLKALTLLIDADLAAARAERGKTKGLYEAKQGDTWELASFRAYGSIGRANDLRDANGIPSGSAPIPGTLYLVPS